MDTKAAERRRFKLKLEPEREESSEGGRKLLETI